MNVVCVYSVGYYESLRKPLATQSDIHFGLAYVATALKEAGFNVELLVITPDTNIKKVLTDYFTLRDTPTRLFCFTAVSSEFPKICEVAKELKTLNPNIHINLGGVHATLNPDKIFDCQFIDSVCIGEGDKAIVELAKELQHGVNPTKINNLWFRLPSGFIEKNPQNGFIQDLDTLPIIDRKMWYPFIKDPVTMPAVLVGRGCPNQCAYCSNHRLGKISPGKYVRFRSPESIIKEITGLMFDYPDITKIYLEVETLSINLPYSTDLCRALGEFNLARTDKIEFRVNISLNRSIMETNIQEFLASFNEANIKLVNIGLESGSGRMREFLRRPKYSNSDLIFFCQMLKKSGIKTSLYIIMGLPTETYREFQQTLKCVKECDPDFVQYGFFYPYPGTDLDTAIRGTSYYNDFDPRFERKRPYTDNAYFTKSQQRREYILMPWKLYMGKLPISNIMFLMLKNLVVQSNLLTRVFTVVKSWV